MWEKFREGGEGVDKGVISRLSNAGDLWSVKVSEREKSRKEVPEGDLGRTREEFADEGRGGIGA